jgi:hypothetical protein
MENKYKVKDWVYSKKYNKAVEVIPYYDENTIFTVSVDAANRWPEIYPRMANGLEIFSTLDHRDRLEAKIAVLMDFLRNLPE